MELTLEENRANNTQTYIMTYEKNRDNQWAHTNTQPTYLLLYTTFVRRIIYKLMCSNALTYITIYKNKKHLIVMSLRKTVQCICAK